MYVPGGKEVTGTGDYITSTDLWRPVGGWVVGGGVVWSLLGGLALSVVRHSAELTPAMTAIHETHDLKKN